MKKNILFLLFVAFLGFGGSLFCMEERSDASFSMKIIVNLSFFRTEELEILDTEEISSGFKSIIERCGKNRKPNFVKLLIFPSHKDQIETVVTSLGSEYQEMITDLEIEFISEINSLDPMENFTSLKSLTLKKCNLIDFDFKHFENLENLRLIDCDIEELKLPAKLKRLTISNSDNSSPINFNSILDPEKLPESLEGIFVGEGSDDTHDLKPKSYYRDKIDGASKFGKYKSVIVQETKREWSEASKLRKLPPKLLSHITISHLENSMGIKVYIIPLGRWEPGIEFDLETERKRKEERRIPPSEHEKNVLSFLSQGDTKRSQFGFQPNNPFF